MRNRDTLLGLAGMVLGAVAFTDDAAAKSPGIFAVRGLRKGDCYEESVVLTCGTKCVARLFARSTAQIDLRVVGLLPAARNAPGRFFLAKFRAVGELEDEISILALKPQTPSSARGRLKYESGMLYPVACQANPSSNG